MKLRLILKVEDAAIGKLIVTPRSYDLDLNDDTLAAIGTLNSALDRLTVIREIVQSAIFAAIRPRVDDISAAVVGYVNSNRK